MRSVSTGRVVPKRCKSWLCWQCNLPLRIGAVLRIVKGSVEVPPGHAVGFMTLTEPAHATLDLAGLYARWEKTKQRFRRRNWISQYALAIELQQRGALHAHVVCWVPLELVPLLRPWHNEKRDRTQWRWHFHEFVPVVRDLGWGKVCDFAAADNFAELGEYAGKSLGRYATKDAHRKLKRSGVRRVRPIRYSHGWTEARLRSFQRGELADPGPWEDVSKSICDRYVRS